MAAVVHFLEAKISVMLEALCLILGPVTVASMDAGEEFTWMYSQRVTGTNIEYRAGA